MRDRNGVERGYCTACAAKSSDCCEFTFSPCGHDDVGDVEVLLDSPDAYKRQPLSSVIRARLQKARDGQLTLIEAPDCCEGCGCRADEHQAVALTPCEDKLLDLARCLFAPLDIAVGVQQSVQDTQSLGMSRTGFTYGEVGDLSMLRILDVVKAHWERRGIQRVAKRHGGVFYDLGCGMGKAVVLAALHPIGFSCCLGVELLPGLCALAADLSDRFGRQAQNFSVALGREVADVNFVEEDLLKVTLEGAGLVLVNAGSWQEPGLSQLRNHLMHALPDGCFLATIRRPIAETGSAELVPLEEFILPMSWGLAPVFLAERRRAMPTEQLQIDLDLMD